MSTELNQAVEQLEKEFTIDSTILSKLTNHFIESIKQGLSETNKSTSKALPMIPTYVTSIPSGTEHGVYLAADLGGTNLRVCSVNLRGDSTFKLEQSKNRIPEDLLSCEAHELFSYLAKKIGQFVATHHPEHCEETDESKHLKLGFTFSYPIDQTSLNSGTLIRWTKGFNIPDAVGRDVVQLLQLELDAQKVPVKVVAIANDTVGTLLSHAYTTNASPNGKQGDTVIGAIFGTGTNGCYLEPLDEIKKLDPAYVQQLKARGVKHMVVNTEWGSFDNELKYLPNTVYDQRIDKVSANPGFHMFEKRISGMYLGEILRQVLVEFNSRGLMLQQYRGYDNLPHRLRTPFNLDSEVLSHIEIDDSSNLRETELSLLQALRLPTNEDERVAI